MPTSHRASHPTAIAPDGAEIRALIDRAQGATRLSLAEALVPSGQRTAKVFHQTIYEEIWYILQGVGVAHLHHPGATDEEHLPIVPGDALLILPGHGFWVENTGAGDLIFLCCGAPPWPGDQEARPWPRRGA
jgi:mannose-6-phosphate isomerase-like protein (cupin superfamily)